MPWRAPPSRRLGFLEGQVDEESVSERIFGAEQRGRHCSHDRVPIHTPAPKPGEPEGPDPEAGLVVVLLCEGLFTFALSLVVLNVATDDATVGNSYYGLAIGFTVLAGAFAVGAISGGAFNPAVGTGPILVDALAGDGSFGQLWIYWTGPLLGSVAAAGVYDLQHPS